MKKILVLFTALLIVLASGSITNALVLLEDSFDDGILDGWTQIENWNENIVGTWSVQDGDDGPGYNGVLEYSSYSFDQGFGYIQVDNLLMPDSYALQFDARMVDYNLWNGSDHIMWFFNFVNHGNFVEGNLRQNPCNDLLLSEKIGGTYSYLVQMTQNTQEDQ